MPIMPSGNGVCPMKLPNSREFVEAGLSGSLINALVELEDAAALITAGLSLSLAGTARALRSLPAGNWIGGTTPYFMTVEGGTVVGDDRVFVTNLSALGSVTVACFGPGELDRISGDAPESGFALAIMPAESECHGSFALDAPFYPQAFIKPTVGWISGYLLSDGGPALVFDGRNGTSHTNRVVVAHVDLGEGALAVPAIVNPFRAGSGEVLSFSEPGFVHTMVMVDGIAMPFAEYCVEEGFGGGQVPLVGDYGGAAINVSIREVDRNTGEVHLYAPVFPGVEYRFAEPLYDYVSALAEGISAGQQDAFWSCNCILNFLFGHLEGKAVGGVAGPVTFGEIAYQLVNQTFVSIRKL